VQKAADIADRLVRQIVSPVQWVTTVRNLPPAAALELGPGKVLTGLVRKINPGLSCTPVAGPEEIEIARKNLAERS
jgi:[acyl-carrier-protein] S-malonyltransferase